MPGRSLSGLPEAFVDKTKLWISRARDDWCLWLLFGFVVVLLVAACATPAIVMTAGPDMTNRWDISTFVMTAFLSVLAVGLTIFSHVQNKHQNQRDHCNALLLAWANKCDAAVCLLERQLYTADGDTGEYLYNTNERTSHAKALAKRALELMSNSGQPQNEAIHKAKQHLNRWAEDASLLYGDGADHKIPQGYLPLLESRAKMYMRCAEPLNWAWHVTTLKHRHMTLEDLMKDKDDRITLAWHQWGKGRSGRVEFMVELSGIEKGWRSSGSMPWREPCKRFWDVYCNQKYSDDKISGYATAERPEGSIKCCQLYWTMRETILGPNAAGKCFKCNWLAD